MANKGLDTKSYILSLENYEYELIMTLLESTIEFKLVPKTANSDFFYKEKFDLSTINEKKYLIITLKDLKKAFEKFEKLLNDKKVKLIREKEDTINLNLQIDIMDEEFETNLTLKQYKINKDDAYPILLNKINEMNKKIDLMYEDYLKRKQEEEIKKQEKEKQKYEELIRKEVEKKLKLNDNVNLSNDFQSKNIDLKEYYSIAKENFHNDRNCIAVYPIIRINERLYELACIKEDRNRYSNIVIYNILLNKKTNVIYNAHGQNNSIENIKHYYYSSKKKHFLLSASQCEIKLWNISSEIITNEFKITAEKNINYNQNNNNYNNNNYSYNLPYYYYFNCSCLLFEDDNYIIFSGCSNSDIKIYNGNYQTNIGNSKIKGVKFIEAAYVGDKSYILLAGGGNSESYDYKNNSLKEYISKNEKNENISTDYINLFNKDNKIYLITAYNDGKVVIFDFDSAEEKFSIKINNGYNFGLCSLNEKYFLVYGQKEINVIDFDKKRSIKNYKDLYDEDINGLEKIKIPDKGEFIISYSQRIITLWKINN